MHRSDVHPQSGSDLGIRRRRRPENQRQRYPTLAGRESAQHGQQVGQVMRPPPFLGAINVQLTINPIVSARSDVAHHDVRVTPAQPAPQSGTPIVVSHIHDDQAPPRLRRPDRGKPSHVWLAVPRLCGHTRQPPSLLAGQPLTPHRRPPAPRLSPRRPARHRLDRHATRPVAPQRSSHRGRGRSARTGRPGRPEGAPAGVQIVASSPHLTSVCSTK